MAHCAAQDDRFDIARFQVEGNTLLKEAEIERLVAPLAGPRRVYGDVQKALEALERAYRDRGFSTVQVYVPEQELTTGTVRIQIIEGVLGKVIISGNQFFDAASVRRGMPALREGRAPNLREISQNIQLVNENPAKQVEVTMAVSEEEGKVDAKVAVTEENPRRTFMTVDGTGTAATGRSRVGFAYQDANLFNRDHTLTVSYTGSPDAPGGVKVNIISIGYRVPFYGLGDSMDFVYGKSSVNTPSTSPVAGGQLGIVGKGDVMGLRWNHYFARRGEYTSKLIAGIDYKYINARCSSGVPPAVLPDSIDPPTPTRPACIPYTSRPLSLTYNGARQSPGQAFDYNIGLAYNVPLGTKYGSDVSRDRYSYLTGRPTRDDFTILRSGGSYLKSVATDWQVRVAANGQYSANPLVSAEQFGLAGSTAVRGFSERAKATDSGYFFNTEIYTPDFGKTMNLAGSMRLLAFYDFGRGYNSNISASGLTKTYGISSLGAGVRYTVGKNFSLRFDLASVIDSDGATTAVPPTQLGLPLPPNTKNRGDWRGNLNLMIGF